MYEFYFDVPNKRDRRNTTASELGLVLNDEIYWDGQYKYSNIWFHRDQKPLWDALYLEGYWPNHRARSYLEIGVCEGASLIWFLDHIAEENDSFSHAMAIDPYIAPRRHKQKLYDRHEQNLLDNLAKHPLGNKVQRMRESSVTALAKLMDSHHRYDCVYVDGDHLAQNALYDMVLAWRLMKKGGVMIVDDLHRRFHNGKPQVREAVDAFFATHEKCMDVPYRGPRQIVMVKESE